MAEIQKISQVLARIMGLKNETNYDEAEELIHSTLRSDFGIDPDQLEHISVAEFDALVKSLNFSPEKLDLLGQFLFESVHPFEDIPETDNILHKVLLIFKILEEEHHIQSFDNLNRRDMIDKFLNNRQYE